MFYAKSPKCNATKSLPNNYASAIFEDSSGDIWIGTHAGFVKYNKETQETERVIKDINISYSILEDINNKDVLWIATYQYGFFKYNKKTGKLKNYKHDKNNPNSIAHDFSLASMNDKLDHNIIWIAQQPGGLDKFDKKTEKFTHYKHNPKDDTSIASDIVWFIYQDSNGNIWFAPMGGLINLIKRQALLNIIRIFLEI